MGREVTPAIRGQCLALSPLLLAPTGCPRPLLAVSRLFVFNIYLHLPFPSPPPSHPRSSSSSPSNARRPAAHNRTGFPRPETLPWAASGRHLPRVGGAGALVGSPAAPPPPSLGAHPPSPLLPRTLETQREEREKPDTQKKGRRMGQRDCKPGVGTEGLGREGRQEGQRRKKKS